MELVNLISQALLWALVIGLAFLLLGALRSLGLLSWRLAQLEATAPSRIGRSGLKPGKKAPEFRLPSVAGGEVSLANFAGRKVLLVFVQSGCGPCHDIAPELNRLAAHNSEMQVLVVNNANAEEAREYARRVDAQFPVLVQEKWIVSKRYEVFATPFAFLIDERGVVGARGIVSSQEHIGYLFSSAASTATKNGEAAPDVASTDQNARNRTNGTGERTASIPVSLSATEVHHV
jgi:methylamine dehydrogenase accessory protein MauD